MERKPDGLDRHGGASAHGAKQAAAVEAGHGRVPHPEVGAGVARGQPIDPIPYRDYPSSRWPSFDLPPIHVEYRTISESDHDLGDDRGAA